MRPFTSTISFAEAQHKLRDAVDPISRVERVGLDRAAGRVAAEDVISRLDVPPFARSAMDGYALVAADTTAATSSSPASLEIVERIYTGQVPRTTIVSGICAEIATGAPLPGGADAVVMVEQTRPDGEHRVLVDAAAASGQNIGRRGADISAGAIVVRRGDTLNPARIGAVAAIGCGGLDVYAQPRVAILSTGNEVIEPGAPLAPGQIFDVNRFTLAAIVEANGGVADGRRPVEDSLESLTAALDACADADVIVFSGGSSVGVRDLIVDLVALRGEMIFHGIAVKPGKPTAFARLHANGTPFFGMPGNPTSCLSNAYLLLVPYLRALARLAPLPDRTIRVPLGRRIVSQAGRLQFYTVKIEDGVALPAFKGSGEITSLSQADGYIQIPPDQSVVEEGDEVAVTLF
jgi:molybdenum cofactor synthesis domain-containing protein